VIVRVEVDGRPAGPELLRLQPLGGYGHFTAMQVRNRCTRGLDRHLARLDAGNRALFGTGLDGDRVRAYIRHALGDDLVDASVRVYSVESGDEVPVVVTVREPQEPPATAQRLRSVGYVRPVAHIKHLGHFGQTYHRRRAQSEGYDEALLTGPDGAISEGGITNIGFWDGSTVIWPDAPALAGITMQLLDRGLTDRGEPARRQRVYLRDVPSSGAAFVTNSHGIAPVDRIDDVSVPAAPQLVKTLVEIYESTPWDPV
jgi:branched-subunit amino acid aminotransferase/4-amino-4-deoxychorismate lyase